MDSSKRWGVMFSKPWASKKAISQTQPIHPYLPVRSPRSMLSVAGTQMVDHPHFNEEATGLWFFFFLYIFSVDHNKLCMAFLTPKSKPNDSCICIWERNVTYVRDAEACAWNPPNHHASQGYLTTALRWVISESNNLVTLVMKSELPIKH